MAQYTAESQRDEVEFAYSSQRTDVGSSEAILYESARGANRICGSHKGIGGD